jgi:hypothetical protein
MPLDATAHFAIEPAYLKTSPDGCGRHRTMDSMHVSRSTL